MTDMKSIRNKYAQDINYHAAANELGRTISTDWNQEYKDGQIITFEHATSWSLPGGEFEPERAGDITYFFKVDNEMDVHTVDYQNDTEVEDLDATEKEKEVLIKAGAQFEIVDAPNVEQLDDPEEPNWLEVTLHFVGYKE